MELLQPFGGVYLDPRSDEWSSVHERGDAWSSRALASDYYAVCRSVAAPNHNIL